MKRTERASGKWNAATGNTSLVRSASKDAAQTEHGRQITPASEEFSEELYRAYRRPVEGWWSNKWVVDLERNAENAPPGSNERPEW